MTAVCAFVEFFFVEFFHLFNFQSDFFALINSPSSEVLMVNDGGTLEIELVQEFVRGHTECML